MITKEASWPAIEMGATAVMLYFTKSLDPFTLFYLIRLVLAQVLESDMTKLNLPPNDTRVADNSHPSSVGDTNCTGRKNESRSHKANGVDYA